MIMVVSWSPFVTALLFQLKASYVSCDTIQTYFGASGTCYRYSANIATYPQRNYDAALSYCKGQSDDLVVIENQEENDIIDNFLFVAEGLEFWLGITNHSGDWYLGDNSTAPFLDITTTAGSPTGQCVVAAPDTAYADGKIWRKSQCVDNRDTVCELLCNDTLTTVGATTPDVTTSTTTIPDTTAAITTTSSTTMLTTSQTPSTPPTTWSTTEPTTRTSAESTTQGVPSTVFQETTSSRHHTAWNTVGSLPVLANFSFFPMEEITWNVWLPWSTCTVSCGGGVQVRWRLCSSNSYLCERRIEPENVATPTNGQQQCVSGYSLEGQNCANETCPTFGFWFSWGAWGDCSATCDVGTRRRSRICAKPATDSADCVGRNISNERCHLKDCDDTYSPIVKEPVDGGVAYKESDRRASAKAVGTVGIVFMVVTVVMLLICDIFQVKPSTAKRAPSKKK